MLGAKRNVLYIGKAKNLKYRVTSYFTGTQTLKTAILVSHIHDIDTIVTRTEKEALLLENQLIKELQPKYNIALKDDKSYPYIKITTQDPFPRILVVRQKKHDQATYFGPYPSIGSTNYLQKMLYDLFPIRDCKQAITLDKKQPKCILLDMGKCIGPCIDKTTKKDYDHLVQELIMLLSGKNKALLTQLRQEMKRLSNDLHYEKAATIRDKLHKIEQLMESQTVHLTEQVNYQVWSFVDNDTFMYILVQELVSGKLISQRGFYQEKLLLDDSSVFIEHTFANYKSDYITLPDALLCHETIANILRPLLSRIGHILSILSPKRGLKYQLLSAANQNAKLALARLSKMHTIPTSTLDLLAQLQETLSLQKLPLRIIGVDISHLQGTHTVGAAVSFYKGTPDKQGYRRYNIKEVTGHSHDPQAIAEVVRRRLSASIQGQEPLPQLILIDGGKGQLNFAYKALKDLKLVHQVDMIAIAKREEEIYCIGQSKPIRWDHKNPILHVLQQVRDESHRFALRFQREKRHRYAQESILMRIDGLGTKRINALYRHFGSLDKMKQASIQDLASISGIGNHLASTILGQLNLT